MTDARNDEGHATQTRAVPPEPDRRTGRRLPSARLVSGVCLGLGAALIPALVLHSFAVNISFVVPASLTPADGVRYLLIAGACLGLLLTGVVAAVLVDRPLRLVLGIVLLVLAVAVAAALPVPSDRWLREERPVDPAPRGPVCMGEGDPDCIGG